MAIWFQEKEDGISLYIRDNGASFSSETKGIGLKSLQELAKGLGGKLLIEGVPSRGTTVHLIVPFKGYDAVKEEKL
jgi:signal transduction histidine kinase